MKIFIHPGFHKTATTFLQLAVFSDDTVFNSLGTPEAISAIIERPHPFVFDARLARDAIERSTPLVEDRPNILSSETLCGNPFFGSRDVLENARRVAEVFPQASVLFTVRGQRGAASSLYKQYVKMGGLASPRTFFARQDVPQFYSFDPITIDYGLTVDAYAKLFSDRVLVLPQELMKRDPDAFFAELGRFLGTDLQKFSIAPRKQSPSPSAKQISAYRAANLFSDDPINPDIKIGPAILARGIRSAANRLLPSKDKKPCPIAATFEEVCSYDFAPGNRILQHYCPVDLAGLGYDLAAAQD